MLFNASAPGSVMLLGEYAVLHGHKALVCAVDKRMTVQISPRDDKTIFISSALGELSIPLSELLSIPIQPPFQFIIAILKKYARKIKTGCDIKIVSEFSDKIGFASSAAVTVAMLSALSHWLLLPFSNDNNKLIKAAREIVHSVQATGSGADVAACVLGGAVAYQMQPFYVEKLLFDHPITLLYSGSKTPTVDAIAHVQNFFQNKKILFRQLCRAIGICSELGIQAVIAKNWQELGRIMNIQQGVMDALGVNTPILSGLIEELRRQEKIVGAKISGSGLGDCVMGLGACQQDNRFNIPVSVTEEGVRCEKI